MTLIGVVKTFNINIPSGTTTSDPMSLGGSYGKIMIGIPTMVSATDIYPEVSDAIDGVFRRVYECRPLGNTYKIDPINYDSSISNCFIELKTNAEFLRLSYSSALSETSHNFKILCSTN